MKSHYDFYLKEAIKLGKSKTYVSRQLFTFKQLMRTASKESGANLNSSTHIKGKTTEWNKSVVKTIALYKKLRLQCRPCRKFLNFLSWYDRKLKPQLPLLDLRNQISDSR